MFEAVCKKISEFILNKSTSFFNKSYNSFFLTIKVLLSCNIFVIYSNILVAISVSIDTDIATEIYFIINLHVSSIITLSYTCLSIIVINKRFVLKSL